MTWPIVEPSNVADLWRPLTDEESVVAVARIKLVEAELRRELRLHGVTGTPVLGAVGYETVDMVEEWITLYIGIVAGVAAGSLKNPEGWSEETEQIDDYQRTRRRDASSVPGASYIDESVVARLLPSRRERRGAFSIRLGQA